MSVATKKLIEVQVLSRKMAKQIEIVKLDWNEGSRHMEIFRKLMAEKTSPIGWVFYSEIVEPTAPTPLSITRARLWLVKDQAQLVWYVAPSEGTLGEMYKFTEQLFLS